MKNKTAKIISTLTFSLCLLGFTIYAALDTFVIKRVYKVVESQTTQTTAMVTTSDSEYVSESNSTAASETENSEESSEASITITTYRENDTDIYVADVVVPSVDSLKTYFADNAYGKNLTEKTSQMASEAGATLAINGDYYGAREYGYVIRNGVLYRSKSDGDTEDLVIYYDGTFEIINESDITAEELLNNGAKEVFSFGPGLLENGEITVSENDEVDQATTSNPRTVIGIIDENHYVFVVSDGRTDESEGLTLYEMAEFLQSIGVQTAYNLDGGGSSTMYYNGEIINNPVNHGSTISERAVSDIIYIA